MSWPETITLAITIFIAMTSGMIYGNRRFDDLRTDMNARFGDVSARFGDVSARLTDMNAKFAELRSDVDTRFGELRADIRDLRALIQEDLRRRAS